MLLLADSRLPSGGHAHSGGLEPAASAGVVADVAGLESFLRGRLATSGLVAAAIAAAAHACGPEGWARLDREADARTPSPAQRRASRAQGRSLLRAVRIAWPDAVLGTLAGLNESGPHHPVVLGAAVAAQGPTTASSDDRHGATGGDLGTSSPPPPPYDDRPEDAGRGARAAALVAAYGAVTGPASAAVRLLGLDPLAVHRVLAGLADEIDAVAARAAACATGDPADLPAVSAPMLDVYAELHLRADLRLFES
ncbi:urease accessory protein [Thermomonospora umbrina]|uniref:Urease accessory protein n=1 Tax=Thermomonospora umbrina TaxID=111806 RepID=A0A3D9T3K3_9ACTN|nr:urease accessory protein [Thermomonospora umbrina]